MRKIANKQKTGKYIGFAAILAIAIILAQGLFRPKAPAANSNSTSTVHVANDNDTAINLNYSLNIPAPLPIKKLPPPPPSILPIVRMNSITPMPNDDIRLKSPTQVFSADNNTVNNSSSVASGDSNSGFSQQAGNASVITVSAKQNSHMDYKILQGKFINAILETSINSDMPGMVRAVVSKDIYSDTGKFVLFPRGTRLIGLYNSNIAVGQTRVMIVWTRAITPQHLDIALGSPSADSLGQSGLNGEVDNHFWQIFGTSALLSTLGATASMDSSGSDEVNGNPYQMAATQGMLGASNDVLQQRINVKPTIHINQGSIIKVFVARDLDFSKLFHENT